MEVKHSIQVSFIHELICLFLFIVLPISYQFESLGQNLIFVFFLSVLFLQICTSGRIRSFFKDITLNLDSIKIPYLGFLIFILWGILLIINSKICFTTIVRLVQLVSALFIFFEAALIKFKKTTMQRVKICIEIIVSIIFIHWLLNGATFGFYQFLFNNSNFFGFLMFHYLVFFSLIPKGFTNKIFCALIWLFLIVSSSRAALFAAIIYKFVYYILKNRNTQDFSYMYKFIIAEIIGIIAMINIYVILKETVLGIWLDQKSLDIFHKSLFSGRNLIWGQCLDLIKDNPIFGYGLNVEINKMIEANFTAHNLYLQTSIQSGLVGCILLLILLVLIMKAYINNKIGVFKLQGMAFLVALLFSESFEITLTQNIFLIGAQSWFILGLGANEL